MAWETLKQAVINSITSNGEGLITGEVLRNLLVNNIIPRLGDLQYAGIATPATVPGNPDGNVFYLASTPGVYSNFSGITLEAGQLAVLRNISSASWQSDVIYSSNTNQNNIGRLMFVGYLQNQGLPFPDFRGEVVAKLNEMSFEITETQTPVVIRAAIYQEENTPETALIYQYIFTKGKGTYGAGGTAVIASNLITIGFTNPTPQSIEQTPGVQIISLGELPTADYVTAANSIERDLSDQGDEDENGNVITYYFSYTQDDVLYLLQFIGAAGVYGGVGNPAFTEPMFVSVTNSNATPTPNIQQVLTSGFNTNKQIIFQIGNELLKISNEGLTYRYENREVKVIFETPVIDEGQTVIYKFPAKTDDDVVAMRSDIRTDYGRVRKIGKGFVKDALGNITANELGFDDHEKGDLFEGVKENGNYIPFMRYNGTGDPFDIANHSWNAEFTAPIPGEPDYIAPE